MSHASVEVSEHVIRSTVTRVGVRTERKTVVRDAPSKRVVRLDETVRTVVRHTGPKGDPGAAGSGFNFSQATPATVWTIAHNLGFWPDVATYRLGGTEIKGAVHHLDLTAMTVTFNIPVAGYARLS